MHERLAHFDPNPLHSEFMWGWALFAVGVIIVAIMIVKISSFDWKIACSTDLTAVRQYYQTGSICGIFAAMGMSFAAIGVLLIFNGAFHFL